MLPSNRLGYILEYLSAFAVLALLCRVVWMFVQYGQLPQPFFYESFDTFMDWFNPAYWARNVGTYTSWKSIYPPISFVALRLLGAPGCYTNADPVAIRDCDWVGIGAIHILYLINVVLVSITFVKIDRRTALPRSIALGAGMPMLYGLERGNLILLCFPFVILAFGPLVRSARLRWICAGIAINFKVYILALVTAQLLKRRWLWFEGALVSTIIVYFVTYGLFGAGSPFEIVDNIVNFSDSFAIGQVLDVWYPVTYQPLIALLGGKAFPIHNMIDSFWIETGLVLFPALVRLGQVFVLAAALATWLRPEAVPNYRLAFFGAAFALMSSEAGGYTQVVVILFAFMEPWRGVARPVAIICCYLLCLPGEIGVGVIPPLSGESFLAGHPVEVHLSVGVGMFLRPGLLIASAIALSSATIWDVWTDYRQQGWKRRWRYRQDRPLLPGVARPSGPDPRL